MPLLIHNKVDGHRSYHSIVVTRLNLTLALLFESEKENRKCHSLHGDTHKMETSNAVLRPIYNNTLLNWVMAVEKSSNIAIPEET